MKLTHDSFLTINLIFKSYTYPLRLILKIINKIIQFIEKILMEKQNNS